MKLVVNKRIHQEGDLLTKEIILDSGDNWRDIDVEEYDAVIIKPTRSGLDLKRFIQSLRSRGKIVIGYGSTNKVTRFLLERTDINLLMDPHTTEFTKRFDFMHHFNSGLNHIFVDIARKRGIRFFFSLNFLKGRNWLSISKDLGRINQNLMICRKRGVGVLLDFLIYSEADRYESREIRSILSFFSLSTEQVEVSFRVLREVKERIKKEKEGKIIQEGIEVI